MMVYHTEAGFVKPRNVTSNYAVYWSQLTATIQCSLQPVLLAQFKINRRRIDIKQNNGIDMIFYLIRSR